jgi:hypothetical protein
MDCSVQNEHSAGAHTRANRWNDEIIRLPWRDESRGVGFWSGNQALTRWAFIGTNSKVHDFWIAHEIGGPQKATGSEPSLNKAAIYV